MEISDIKIKTDMSGDVNIVLKNNAIVDITEEITVKIIDPEDIVVWEEIKNILVPQGGEKEIEYTVTINEPQFGQYMFIIESETFRNIKNLYNKVVYDVDFDKSYYRQGENVELDVQTQKEIYNTTEIIGVNNKLTGDNFKGKIKLRM